MPLICVLSPAWIETLRLGQWLEVSPDHSAAPHLCIPAHALRVSITTSFSPSEIRPSWIVRVW